jgi:DNA polymerase
MTQKDQVQELRELIAATKNHFAYIQELGVENIEIPTALAEGLRQPSTANLTTGGYTEPVKNSRPAQHETSLRAAASELSSDVLFGDFAPVAPRLAKSNETFEEIWTNIGDCTRCPLYQGRTHIVHTEGNRKARLMFVGEAPGADEDVQARPFVGKAGQLLTKIIEAIGFKREEVLIGNVNRCRPPGNRPPTAEEAGMCKPFLLREIAVVQPEVIVVMGNTAMRNLLETKDGITKLRGTFQDYKGIKVMPTFHPAYLLRDPSKKRETWEDLKKVRDYLDETSRMSAQSNSSF